MEMLAGGSRRDQTCYDDIVEGMELAEAKWCATVEAVAGLISSDFEYDPWYLGDLAHSGVVPPLATYPVVRAQIPDV